MKINSSYFKFSNINDKPLLAVREHGYNCLIAK